MFFSPEQCHLSICLKADGFYFLIVYTPENRTVYERWFPIISSQSYFEEFKEAVYAEPLLLSEFADCSVIVDSRQILVCPPHFSRKGIVEFYQMSYGVLEDELYIDISREFNIYIAYSARHALIDFLKRTFFYRHMNCVQSLILEALSPLVTEQTGKQMFIRLYESKMELYLFENGLLYSITDFSTSTLDDSLYFLLNTWENRGISQTQEPLFLFGKEELVTEMERVVKKYIKQVEILPKELFESFL